MDAQRESSGAHYVTFHSRTAAALEDRRRQQRSPRDVYRFLFPASRTEVRVCDALIDTDNLQLHTGLLLQVHLTGTELARVEDVARDYADAILSLVSVTSQSACSQARLVNRLEQLAPRTFNALVSSERSRSTPLLAKTRTISTDLLGQLFTAFFSDLNPNADRMTRAVAWLRKAMVETHQIDSFLAYWISMETIASLLRDLLQQKKRRPGQWDGVKDILEARPGAPPFSQIWDARQAVVHSKQAFAPSFLADLASYSGALRGTIVAGIGELLGLDNEWVSKTTDLPPIGVPNDFTHFALGTLTAEGDNTETLSTIYACGDKGNSPVKYKIDENGDLSLTASPRLQFCGMGTAKLNVNRVEVRR